VYDKGGHIVTNSHVVTLGKDQRIDVTFSDGTIYRANITGIDQYSDLAVLHVDGIPKEKLAPLPLGNSSDLTVGQPVAAIGNPFGLSGSLSRGIVSGLDRLIPSGVVPQDPFSPSSNMSSPLFSIPNVIQTDAPINPGNSGGPLLDMEGNVIGLNTAIFSTTGVFAGVGFAVPSNSIAKVIPSLIEKSSYEHPWLGLTGTDMTPDIAKAIKLHEPRGFLVVDADKGGPAAKAGIHGSNATSSRLGEGREAVPLGGDVIISIDNTTVRKIDDLLGYLEESTAVGQMVTLTIWRNGQTMDVDVTLAPRPASGLQGSLDAQSG
jgi:S1-C subfamily serine protease